MKVQLAIIFGILVLLAACSPPAPGPEAASPQPEATPSAVQEVEQPSPTMAVATEMPTSVETPDVTGPAALTPTLTEWELVQTSIESLRNLLDRESDGYQGLTTALEQLEPNQAWCGGLSAAIGDFNYINDEESAQALRDLQETQGCP